LKIKLTTCTLENFEVSEILHVTSFYIIYSPSFFLKLSTLYHVSTMKIMHEPHGWETQITENKNLSHS